MADAPVADDGSGPGFDELGLADDLVAAVVKLGYEEPTPIQREAIPVLLQGRDLMGQAATGTGKTAAFALPIVHGLVPAARRTKSPTALVLVPTRELAIQVSEAVHRYGRAVDARVVPVYGGQPIFRQLRALDSGVDVVVATPGRAVDHLGRGSLSLAEIRTVVLDEADEMLDMGFAEDIEEILKGTPGERQTVLFSATMPPRIEAIARTHLTDPVRIELGRSTTSDGDSPAVTQTAYLVRRAHKATALGRILDVEAPTAAIVFCRTRAEVDTLTETLNGRGYRAEALHGGFGQEHRDRVMNRLRSGAADLIVATDVAARGLDIDQLTHVVNYDVPSAPETYVHRIGRVGRAGREGVAITLAEPREHRMLKTIERVTGQKVQVRQVPTVDELRAHQLGGTREALDEVLGGDRDHLDRVRVVVESLSDEHDLMEIALAAVTLVHELRVAGAETDDTEIPVVDLKDERPGKGDRGGKARPGGPKGKPGRNTHTGADMTRLYVSAGRKARVGPGDLVGAIAGETSLSGRDIGSIDVQEMFSLVEVPSGKVDEVIEALGRTTLRGRKVHARREKYTRT
ncbi:DEAD/DEAH box helicase [Iamia sp. SCSIO 61187]|uniref:DEAD/DEAH box helicase n=1 Tax=Iamia sp. SCSIO 61187 TaxID=2722752 RepID=UPI001C637014|nr:DEAD/DEAH box helicase [Iamia sp. SCSIO 61187]QYG91132.1 DEAD/DEAH box helicase [Iamia sp. SCSIO 61187]